MEPRPSAFYEGRVISNKVSCLMKVSRDEMIYLWELSGWDVFPASEWPADELELGIITIGSEKYPFTRVSPSAYIRHHLKYTKAHDYVKKYCQEDEEGELYIPDELERENPEVYDYLIQAAIEERQWCGGCTVGASVALFKVDSDEWKKRFEEYYQWYDSHREQWRKEMEHLACEYLKIGVEEYRKIVHDTEERVLSGDMSIITGFCEGH